MLIDLTEPERLALALALAYVAQREIETDRYPLAPQLEPLRTAIAKLAPNDPPPVPPKSPRPKSRRR
jgi:hypothetical protein